MPRNHGGCNWKRTRRLCGELVLCRLREQDGSPCPAGVALGPQCYKPGSELS